jgi:hypothetical protein
VVTAGWVWVQPLTLAFVYVGTTIKNIADISQGGGDFTRGHFVSDLTYLFMCLSHYKLTTIPLPPQPQHVVSNIKVCAVQSICIQVSNYCAKECVDLGCP